MKKLILKILRSRPGPITQRLVMVLFAMVVSAGLVALGDDFAPVAAFDKLLGDIGVALTAPRAPVQRRDIALVLIDEESLREYDTVSPIDRRLLAKLVEEIGLASPAVIGIDLIFDRTSPNYAEFRAALTRVEQPVVLGAIDDRYALPGRAGKLQRELVNEQEKILADLARPVGHIWLERKEGFLPATADLTVRYIAGDGRGKRESFSAVVAKAAGYSHSPQTREISWLKAPDDGAPLFPEVFVPRHSPASLLDPHRKLLQAVESELLRGRIVLIGATLSDRDRHTTPLNAFDHRDVSGIWIHAQAIAQRIDASRDIKVVPAIALFGLLTIVTLVAVLFTRWAGDGRLHTIVKVSAPLLVGFVALAMLRFLRIDVSSGLIASAFAIGVSAQVLWTSLHHALLSIVTEEDLASRRKYQGGEI